MTMFFAILLQGFFIALKMNGLLYDWSWWWVFAPTWAGLVGVLLFLIIKLINFK